MKVYVFRKFIISFFMNHLLYIIKSFIACSLTGVTLHVFGAKFSKLNT